MGIRCYCDEKNKITYSVWDGTIESGEWLTNIEKLMQDPTWRENTCWFVDQTTVKDVSAITEAEVLQIVQFLKSHRHEHNYQKLAVVANNSFGLARMLEGIMRSINITTLVFYNFTTACIYTDIDEIEARTIFTRLRTHIRET